eukprot:jgi/Mesvir1/22907/Mv19426-RA.1
MGMTYVARLFAAFLAAVAPAIFAESWHFGQATWGAMPDGAIVELYEKSHFGGRSVALACALDPDQFRVEVKFKVSSVRVRDGYTAWITRRSTPPDGLAVHIVRGEIPNIDVAWKGGITSIRGICASVANDLSACPEAATWPNAPCAVMLSTTGGGQWQRLGPSGSRSGARPSRQVLYSEKLANAILRARGLDPIPTPTAAPSATGPGTTQRQGPSNSSPAAVWGPAATGARASPVSASVGTGPSSTASSRAGSGFKWFPSRTPVAASQSSRLAGPSAQGRLAGAPDAVPPLTPVAADVPTWSAPWFGDASEDASSSQASPQGRAMPGLSPQQQQEQQPPSAGASPMTSPYDGAAAAPSSGAPPLVSITNIARVMPRGCLTSCPADVSFQPTPRSSRANAARSSSLGPAALGGESPSGVATAVQHSQGANYWSGSSPGAYGSSGGAYGGRSGAMVTSHASVGGMRGGSGPVGHPLGLGHVTWSRALLGLPVGEANPIHEAAVIQEAAPIRQGNPIREAASVSAVLDRSSWDFTPGGRGVGVGVSSGRSREGRFMEGSQEVPAEGSRGVGVSSSLGSSLVGRRLLRRRKDYSRGEDGGEVGLDYDDGAQEGPEDAPPGYPRKVRHRLGVVVVFCTDRGYKKILDSLECDSVDVIIYSKCGNDPAIPSQLQPCTVVNSGERSPAGLNALSILQHLYLYYDRLHEVTLFLKDTLPHDVQKHVWDVVAAIGHNRVGYYAFTEAVRDILVQDINVFYETRVNDTEFVPTVLNALQCSKSSFHGARGHSSIPSIDFEALSLSSSKDGKDDKAKPEYSWHIPFDSNDCEKLAKKGRDMRPRDVLHCGDPLATRWATDYWRTAVHSVFAVARNRQTRSRKSFSQLLAKVVGLLQPCPELT